MIRYLLTSKYININPFATFDSLNLVESIQTDLTLGITIEKNTAYLFFFSSTKYRRDKYSLCDTEKHR